MILTDKAIAACKVEADRQGCDEAGYQRLLTAYEYSWQFAQGKCRRPFLKWLMEAAWILEPQKNPDGRFRQTPVNFGPGTWTPSANVVPNAINGLFLVLNTAFEVKVWEDTMIEEWVREFLEIHPFLDGNGRLAWIMQTWLKNEWLDPSPLKEYTFM